MKKIIFTLLNIFLTIGFMALSLRLNNNGVCCDMPYAAGWPVTWYGGSGGFKGTAENSIYWSGFVIDVFVWLTISVLSITPLFLVLFALKNPEKIYGYIKSHHARSIVIGFLLGGVIALLASYYVVTSLEKPVPPSPVPLKTAEPTTFPTPTAAPTPIIGPQTIAPVSGGFMIIKELGIKIPVSKNLSDLTYVTQRYPDYPVTVWLSTTQLEKTAGQWCTPMQGTLGIISTPSTPQEHRGTMIKKLGNNYLYYAGPQATCSDDTSVQALQTQTLKELQDQLKTAELYQ